MLLLDPHPDVLSHSQDMASNQFAKLCKDSKLINDRVKKADIDIIFSR
jgi:hypothetical protein